MLIMLTNVSGFDGCLLFGVAPAALDQGDKHDECTNARDQSNNDYIFHAVFLFLRVFNYALTIQFRDGLRALNRTPNSCRFESRPGISIVWRSRDCEVRACKSFAIPGDYAGAESE